MHHTAAWQLHLVLSVIDVEWICTASIKTVTVVQPREYQRSNQSMHGVVIRELAKLMYFAHVKETRSHTLFGVIVHCQRVNDMKCAVTLSSWLSLANC